MSIAPGAVLDVEIQRIVPGGIGLGHAEGSTLLVPLTAPGDRVRVRIIGHRGRTATAELVDVLTPGPGRATPPCPYFGRCGGCDFQQLAYEAQLDAKRGIVIDAMRRIGGVADVEVVVIPSPKPLAYRGRARWQHATQPPAIGYFARNSRTVIDVTQCPILEAPLNGLLADLRSAARDGAAVPESVEAAMGQDGVSTRPPVHGLPSQDLEFSAAGERYTYSADCFFQTNLGLVEALIDAAVGGEAPILEGAGIAVDLYCGVGLFSVPLARKYTRVFGVEISPKTVRYAKANAALAGVPHATFVAQPTGAWIAERAKNLKHVDVIVADPPRTGLDAETMAGVLRMRPRRIVSVSCDPATFARDAKAFIGAGYRLDGGLTVLDMFPQNHHVEIVGRFEITEPAELLVGVDDQPLAASTEP